MYVFQECRVFKGSYYSSSPPYFPALYFFCFNSLVAANVIVFVCQVICPMTELNIMQPQQSLCSSLDVRPFPLPALSCVATAIPSKSSLPCRDLQSLQVLRRGTQRVVDFFSTRLWSAAQWKCIGCLMLPCLTWDQHHSDKISSKSVWSSITWPLQQLLPLKFQISIYNWLANSCKLSFNPNETERLL